MAAVKHTSMREDFSRVNTRVYSDERTATTIEIALDAIGDLRRTLLLADEEDGIWTLDHTVTIPANVFLEVPLGVTITGPGNLIILGGVGGLRWPLHAGPGVIEWEGSTIGPTASYMVMGDSVVDTLEVRENLGVLGTLQVGNPPVEYFPEQIIDVQQEISMVVELDDRFMWRHGLRCTFWGTQHANSPTHFSAMNTNANLDPKGWYFSGVVASLAGNVFVHSTIGGTVANAYGIYGAVFNVSPGRVINLACVVAHEIPYAWNNGPITNYMGLLVHDTIRGDNTYGIYSTMSARTKKWNLFCQGSAVNYMAAALGIGSAGGVPPANYLLHVNGWAGKPGGGSWSDVSSQTLKTNIEPIPDALETLLALKGRRFEWTEEEHARLLPGTQYGLVAEEVETVVPSWVETTEADDKVLTIRGFEALTIESLRAIVARLEALEGK